MGNDGTCLSAQVNRREVKKPSGSAAEESRVKRVARAGRSAK